MTGLLDRIMSYIGDLLTTPTETFTGTRASGFTQGTLYGVYDKVSKTVNISFFIQKDSNFGTSDVLFTIPAKYRPAAAITTSGMVMAYLSNAYRTIPSGIKLNTSGQITQNQTGYARAVYSSFNYIL